MWCGVMEGGGAEELAHLGSSSPVSAHGCWPSSRRQSFSFTGGRFRSRAVVFVRGRSFSFVGGRFRSWVWAVLVAGRPLSSLVRFRGGPLVGSGGARGHSFRCRSRRRVRAVTWHCQVVGVVVRVCRGGCGRSVRVVGGRGGW